MADATTISITGDFHQHALGADGPGWSFESLGEVWRILPKSLAVEGLFVDWLKRYKLQQVIRQKTSLPPDDYKELLAATKDEIDRGLFNWGRPGCIRWMMEEVGQLQMALFMMQQAHPGLTLAKLEEIITGNPDGFAAAYVQALSDPNSQSPGTNPTTPAK